MFHVKQSLILFALVKLIAKDASMPKTVLERSRDSFVKEICPDPQTLARFDAYAALLIQWQRVINLVGRRTLSALWDRHFLDSAQLYRYLPGSAKTLIDIGSGGGFPGLVLAILIARAGGPSVTLIESDGRKATFLGEVNRICNAGAQVFNGRAESADLIPADVVTSRACAPLCRLFPLVHQCLQPNGVAFLLKGANWRDELTAAEKDWKIQIKEIPSLTDTSGVILRLEGLNPI